MLSQPWNVEAGISSNPLQYNVKNPVPKASTEGKNFPNEVRVLIAPNHVVKVPFENYLVSVLGSEMSVSWPMESLKAQAIAIRTYTLKRLKNPRSKNYDVTSTVLDQVYGHGKEHSRTWEAVRATQNEVLLDGKELASVFYHARCGGETELPNQIWKGQEKTPYKKVECPFCKKNPSSWSYEISEEKFKNVLGVSGPLDLKGAVSSTSGRWLKVLVDSPETKKLILAEELRSLFGYSNLKSGLFRVTRSEGILKFSGVGAGHGVGLCQWGAKFLAEKKFRYQDILTHFYPGLKTVKINSPLQKNLF